MHEHTLYSLRYLFTFSYSKNNSKFTGSLLKICVCHVSNNLLSMKVKYVYVIQNRKYTGGAVEKKNVWNTVGVISYQFYLYINVISVLCNTFSNMFNFTCMVEINNLGVCKYLKSEMQLTVGPVGPRGQNFRGSGK